jgi:hypothetical protein
MKGILKGGHHAKREKILHADRCRVCLHGGRGGNHAYPYMAIRVVTGVPLGWTGGEETLTTARKPKENPVQFLSRISVSLSLCLIPNREENVCIRSVSTTFVA